MIDTGPGIIRRDRRAHSGINLEWFHLDNFDIDGVTLKTRHRDYLRERFANNFLPTTGSHDLLIPANDIWIFLRGYASRTGDADHNIDLSIQRVDNVGRYLESTCLIASDRITGLDYVGEEWSRGELEEDDMFRSVEVIARQENTPPPPSRPPAIIDRFRMRAKPIAAAELGALVELLSIPGGLGATILKIQIQNRRTRESRYFMYIGGQVTAGLSAPSIPDRPDISSRRPHPYGSWVNFTTRSNRHVSLPDFAGEAAFGSMLGAQIGPWDFGDSFFKFESRQLRNVESWVTINPRTITLPMPSSVGLGFTLASLPISGRLYLLSE